MSPDAPVQEDRTANDDPSPYPIHFQWSDSHCSGVLIWRHSLCGGGNSGGIALLVDLRDLFITAHEIDKLFLHFVVPDVLFIAFANCHTHNRQGIRRKLKALNVRLYSHSAFFDDAHKAKLWLTAQCADC